MKEGHHPSPGGGLSIASDHTSHHFSTNLEHIVIHNRQLPTLLPENAINDKHHGRQIFSN
jgi:hypothetical protein